MSAPLWLGLLALGAPVIYLWLQRPPARALRVSSLLLARALSGAARRRAAPSWLTLLQLLLVIGALVAISVALARGDAGTDVQLALVRLGAHPGPPPAEVDVARADRLLDLGRSGLRERARGAPAVEAALLQPAPPLSAIAADHGFEAEAIVAAVAAERAVAALAAGCVAAPARQWRALDGPSAAALGQAGCSRIASSEPFPSPSALQIAVARPTQALGELELAVAVAGDGAHGLSVTALGTPRTTGQLGAAGALGWSMLRLDRSAAAGPIQLQADDEAPVSLAAPAAPPTRVVIWTAARQGLLARALGAHPSVRLQVAAPGEVVFGEADLLVIAAPPGAPLPAAPVRASLGVDPSPIGGAWRPGRPGRGPLRVGAPSALLNYTAATTTPGAAVSGLSAEGRPSLILPAGARALWLTEAGPALGELTQNGVSDVFLSIDPEAVSPAEQLPLLHLLGNLVEQAGPAAPVASLPEAPDRRWAQSLPPWSAAPAAPPASTPPGPTGLLAAAAGLLLAQGLLGRVAAQARGA